MSGSVLSAITVVLILACLCTVITLCFGMLSSADSQLRKLQRPARDRNASRISVDEIIDLHLALKDLSGLDQIAERRPV